MFWLRAVGNEGSVIRSLYLRCGSAVIKHDLAGLQALLVDNVLLGGEDEPDGDIVVGIVAVGIGEQAFLFVCGRLGRDVGLDLFHEGLGGAQCLR
jgi:hypothetical protein